jgi:hypothetical protein
MKPMAAVYAILIFVIGVEARAEVHEFNLPALAGASADSTVTDTVEYHGPTAAVNSVSLRVGGSVDFLGVLHCVNSGNPTAMQWDMELRSFVRKTGDAGYWASDAMSVGQLGAFEATYGHLSYGGFLSVSDGDVIQVEYYFGPIGYLGVCGPVTDPPSGTSSTVTLILNVSPASPVEETTWGRIKNVYNKSD